MKTKSMKDFEKRFRSEEAIINNDLNFIRGGLDNNTEKTTYRTGTDQTDFDSEMTCDACSGVSAHQSLAQPRQSSTE